MHPDLGPRPQWPHQFEQNLSGITAGAKQCRPTSTLLPLAMPGKPQVCRPGH